MNTNITLTVAQLTLAQMGKDIALPNGEVLRAVREGEGEGEYWCYALGWQNQLGLMRYAGEGLDEAHRVLNASQDEYDEEPKPWE